MVENIPEILTKGSQVKGTTVTGPDSLEDKTDATPRSSIGHTSDPHKEFVDIGSRYRAVGWGYRNRGIRSFSAMDC